MAKKKSKTLVTLLLDRSYSMLTLKADTIDAINAYVDQLKKAEGDLRLSFIQFDSDGGGFIPGRHPRMQIERIFVGKKIEKVEKIGPDDFNPRGGTPLIDATVSTIRAIEESLAGRTDVKVVVAIQTDGEENSSTAHGWDDLRTLIEAKEAQGWEFNFMGAGIDAYQQGARMGLDEGKIISYGTKKDQTEAAFVAAGANTAAFASGTMRSVAYSDQQKMAAGDTH